ncbi:hypothetical protein AC1031_011029 [Aphanomyces cochlioides]|nr:hypothetical protein AC1031_011029 [Aphanomyces cochlioides]
MSSGNSSARNVRPKIDSAQERCDEFQRAASVVTMQVAALEKRMAQWKKLEDQIQANITNAPNIITLDVGGTIFKTSKETLLRFEGSYFHALLGSGQWKPDSPNEAFFLDVDAGYFGRILRYLRTGELSFHGLCSLERDELKTTLEYLSLTDPSGSCRFWHPSLCALGLSEDLTTVTAKYDGWKSVMGTLGAKSIQITELGSRGEVYVGLARRDGFNPSSTHAYSCEYSIYLKTGQLRRNGIVIVKSTVDFRTGDILTIRRLKSKICFERNGQDVDAELKVKETGVQLFLVASLYDKGDKSSKWSILYALIEP